MSGRAALSAGRAAALSALIEARRRDVHVRDLLGCPQSARDLDRRDAAFALRLALGATAARGALDAALDMTLDHPGRVSTRIREALRIAAFELIYLERAPRVAVSQGVDLVGSVARSATGLANAVLRRVATSRDAFLAAADAPAGERRLVASARRAGLPVWLVGAIEDSLGACRTELLLRAQLEPAPLAIHLNPLREPVAHADGLPGCAARADGPSLMASGALDRGEMVVSDARAQLIATAACAPGTCLEIGAGRGTKTFVMAAQALRVGFSRRHTALDIDARRCEACERRLVRAGLDEGIRTVVGDGCDLDRVLSGAVGIRLFSSVLLDAPCSGTGTMRRHPEICWRLSRADAERALPALQGALLSQAAGRVEVGGQLLYATCSVLRSENTDVVDAFLASETGRVFELDRVCAAPILRDRAYRDAAEVVRDLEDERGMMQSAPEIGGYDGHFCARLIRRA